MDRLDPDTPFLVEHLSDDGVRGGHRPHPHRRRGARRGGLILARRRGRSRHAWWREPRRNQTRDQERRHVAPRVGTPGREGLPMGPAHERLRRTPTFILQSSPRHNRCTDNPNDMTTTTPITVAAHGRRLDPSEDAFGWLRPSDDVAGDPEALRARLEEDGYLYVPGALDREAVRAGRLELLAPRGGGRRARPGVSARGRHPAAGRRASSGCGRSTRRRATCSGPCCTASG